ncbi:hypothetical protein [Couchioplanes caeruleus]|uniref:Uncharacterized protein n=2 Tax=Couchioplanes caeruleus TaxID=56438 RepID=A0A1K0GRC1_9ACTN|nr:hypothetical protein [Couchioplanes caeruleus]OJF14950.1 hypothetical protein BG844_07070 [Couchioplanes caeruleus subsp. caeruleus]ROP30445.1 hypothetical protein EDD30_3296 [Couchioplanes caeruleus]
MLWPVMLLNGCCPPDTIWALGERVETRLSWLEDPDLPADLVLHQVTVRAGTWLNANGQPWAQMIEAGDLRALRQGDHRSGDLVLDGCLIVDAYPALTGYLPLTAGVVRRVRLIQDLHEQGTDDWVRRPGGVRLIDVPDAGPDRFRDDPDLSEPTPPDWEPDPDTMRIFSPEQYYALARDRLPAEQWQARGFLIDLDVADPA